MYQLIAPAVLIILLLLSPTSHSSVGKITEQSGPTEIVRSKKSIESKVNASVEMNDTIVTAKSRAQITFEDNTTVKITEQSKLVIDDFVYDPKKGSGKVAMKVVLGTARYASGQIAKNNPQQVDIKTPTGELNGLSYAIELSKNIEEIKWIKLQHNHRSDLVGKILDFEFKK
jgi:hypothetical protein